MRKTSAVNEWVSKAEEDYRAALDLMRRRKAPTFDSVCFHAQQCVEKYMKAFLLQQGVLFPYTHDLELLLRLCRGAMRRFPMRLRQAQLLNKYAIAARYPGFNATSRNAQAALRAMREARRALRLLLGFKR